MAFMQPETDFKIRQECPRCGEYTWDLDLATGCGCGEDLLEAEQGIFVRLSAPGYMDCTDWHGPFKNEFRALRWLAGFYDVDPRTGEELVL